MKTLIALATVAAISGGFIATNDEVVSTANEVQTVMVEKSNIATNKAKEIFADLNARGVEQIIQTAAHEIGYGNCVATGVSVMCVLTENESNILAVIRSQK